MKDWVSDLAKVATFTVAVGDCATWGGIPATAPNPSESEGLQFLKRAHGGFLGMDYTSKAGLPVINIPGCPAHPDWITQIVVAVATGRGGDLTLDEFQRPKTFFTTLHADRLHPQHALRLQGLGDRVRPAQRLSVLRPRLPRADDPFAVQPHPVEPRVVEDARRHAVSRLHRA